MMVEIAERCEALMVELPALGARADVVFKQRIPEADAIARRYPGPMLLLLLGCAPTPDTTDTEKAVECEPQTWYADSDRDGYGDETATKSACEQPDGYVDQAGDCDDSLSPAHPGGSERCNDVDDDCDGELDEDAVDAPTWYGDGDGDGYGGAEHVACDAGEGEISQGGDCDDANPDIHPDVDEICDDVDQDCDGLVDDEPSDGSPWYTDADGDGFGTGAATRACTQPDGMVDHGGDCADSDPTVNPDTAEVCNHVDDDCNGRVDENASDAATWYTDVDHDGYGTGGHLACDKAANETDVPGDCNDHDAAINPDAIELCDSRNVDEDCDGEAEEAGADGETGWYGDADLDGYGDDSTTVVACDAGDGAAAVAGDCDDTRSDVNPGEAELCDPEDVDEDCDGAADGADAAGQAAWFIDGDGDGYGEPDSGHDACGGTALEVDNGDDCDDTDASVHPGATEVCDDALIDQNCDGSNADADAIDAQTYYRDSDGDGFGGTAISRCWQPSGYLTVGGDCDDGDAEVHPDVADPCLDGIDQDCDGADRECGVREDVSAADAVVYGEPGDSLGVGLAFPGDLTGDGVGDLVLGGNLDGRGFGSVVAGPVVGEESLADAEVARIESPYPGIGFASEITTIGDLNGDGVDDVAISCPWFSPVAVYLLPGPLTADVDTTAAFATLADSASPSTFGLELAPPLDADGDGAADLLVNGNELDGGTVGYLFSGPLAGDLDVTAAQASFGSAASAVAGDEVSLEWAGDVDGDGMEDVVSGFAAADDGAGAASLLTGPFSGDVDIDLDAVAAWTGAAGDALGEGVLGGGDMDGDGYAEVWVSASGADDGGADAGALYLLGATTSGAAADVAIARWVGSAEALAFTEVEPAGDVDGDGYADVVATGAGANAAWVLYGPWTSGAHALDDEAPRISAPEGVTLDDEVARGGDLNADGYDDLAFGDPYNATAGTYAGAILLFYGGPR